MQFLSTVPSQTEGSTSAILTSTGLLVTPGAGQFAESSLVAAGDTPSTVTKQGVHLGQLPSSAGTCVRIVSSNNIPSAIDFCQTSYAAFSRGSIQYFFEPSANDRMYFAWVRSCLVPLVSDCPT